MAPGTFPRAVSGLAERVAVSRTIVPVHAPKVLKSPPPQAPTASSTLTPPRRPADSPPATCCRWSAIPRKPTGWIQAPPRGRESGDRPSRGVQSGSPSPAGLAATASSFRYACDGKVRRTWTACSFLRPRTAWAFPRFCRWTGRFCSGLLASASFFGSSNHASESGPPNIGSCSKKKKNLTFLARASPECSQWRIQKQTKRGAK